MNKVETFQFYGVSLDTMMHQNAPWVDPTPILKLFDLPPLDQTLPVLENGMIHVAHLHSILLGIKIELATPRFPHNTMGMFFQNQLIKSLISFWTFEKHTLRVERGTSDHPFLALTHEDNVIEAVDLMRFLGANINLQASQVLDRYPTTYTLMALEGAQPELRLVRVLPIYYLRQVLADLK